MYITKDSKLKKIIVIGDKFLIKLLKPNEKTETGLFLPPGVQEKEKVQQGYIIKAGPGYPIPFSQNDDELWKSNPQEPKYLPLQAREGDLAIFLLSSAVEIIYENEKYYIVPQTGVLMIERNEL